MIKNLKSLFFVEEKNEEDSSTNSSETSIPREAPKKKRKSDSSGNANQVNTNTNSETGSVKEGEVDSKILETLFNALEANNLDGFDYFEFKKSLLSLAKMVKDEATSYKSAFATASTIGVTLDRLIQTADHYKGILDSERAKFNDTVKSQKEQMIGKRKAEYESLKVSIKEKTQQIEDLKKDISMSQNKLDEVEGLITSARNKIAETQANFETSFENIKGQIENDIEKMKKYLK